MRAFLGLFVTVGFVISGGMPNLVGGDGSSFLGTANAVERDTLGTVIGTWIQTIGALTALIAGFVATWNNYRKQAAVAGCPQDVGQGRCLRRLKSLQTRLFLTRL